MTQLHVLIVDQDPQVITALSEKLRGLPDGDYEVTTADNLEDAAFICANSHQDAVLVGLGISGESGLDAISQLTSENSEFALIALAGDGERQLAENALKMGVQDFLIKDRVCGVMMSRSIKYAVEKRRLENVAHFAQYDALTGLATRMLFMDRSVQAMARAKRSKQIFGILYLDLNRFKPINDIYGHETGDVVLKHVASVLKLSVRTGDTVARFGGDEFVVMVEGIDHERGVNTVVEKISSMLREPIQIAGERLSVGVSIGIAMCPMDGSSIKELIHKADLAMYEAKKSGKDFCYVGPDPQHGEPIPQ